MTHQYHLAVNFWCVRDMVLLLMIPSYPLARNVLLLFGAERLRSRLNNNNNNNNISHLTVLSDIWYYYFFRLTAIFIWPCGLAPSQQYSAFWPRPLTEINFLFASRRMSINFSLSASWQNRFSIRLTANVCFIFLTPPHGEIDFLFTSWWMSICFSHAPSRWNRFSIHLTANVDFLFASRQMSILFFLRPFTTKSCLYSPHGGCSFYTLPPPRGDISFALHGVDQFSLWLTARTNFIPPTRCFAPHGGNQCSLSLTARLGFILICAWRQYQYSLASRQ